MNVKVNIPVIMQKVTGGRDIVEVDGKTVRECIDDFIKKYPEAAGWLNPENPVVWMVLNQTVINFNKMDTRVKPGEEIGFITIIGAG